MVVVYIEDCKLSIEKLICVFNNGNSRWHVDQSHFMITQLNEFFEQNFFSAFNDPKCTIEKPSDVPMIAEKAKEFMVNYDW